MISERKKQQEEQLAARLEAGREKREKTEKLAEKKAEKKEQEERLAKQREKRKVGKDNVQTHEVTTIGNDVQRLTEKLVASALSNNSTVPGTTGVDIKI